MTVNMEDDDCEECAQLRDIMGVTREEMTGKKTHTLTTTGTAILCTFGVSFLTLTAITVPFLIPALRKFVLPFVPATDVQVANVMKLIKPSKSKLVDLGSGDGRIVIAASKLGLKATGIELNPWLVWYSRFKAYRQNLHHITQFQRKDIWKTSLAPYDVVVIFGVSQMMAQLEKKFEDDLNSDCQVIACRFPLPNWKPIHTVGAGIDTVWLYRKPLL